MLFVCYNKNQTRFVPVPVDANLLPSQVAAKLGQPGSCAQAPPAHKQLRLPGVGECARASVSSQ